MKNFQLFLDALRSYYEEHGNTLVPTTYEKDGYRLGHKVQWIRHGQTKLSPEQEEALKQYDFVWHIRRGRLPFSELIQLLTVYKGKYGNCKVPTSYVTENGVKLGEILMNIQSGSRKTSPKEIEQLNELGFEWRDPLAKRRNNAVSFEIIYAALKEFYQQNGHVEVNEKYITAYGLKLGMYVQKIRSGRYRLSDDEKALIDEMGFRWKYTSKSHHSFEEVYEALQEYYKLHQDLKVPYGYVTDKGLRLGRAVHSIRYGYRKTTEEEKEKLRALGLKVKN